MRTVGVHHYGRRLQDVTGGNGISFETAELGRAVSAFGYHVSRPSTLRRCAGDIGFGSGIGEYRLHCDLDHGAIGGPWLSGFAGVDEGGTGTGTIISVTSRTSFMSGD